MFCMYFKFNGKALNRATWYFIAFLIYLVFLEEIGTVKLWASTQWPMQFPYPKLK